MTKQSEPIDDDTFDYDGGMSQCISGHGRNTVSMILERVEEDYAEFGRLHPKTKQAIRWHVMELVRWCRDFNGQLKRIKAEPLPADREGQQGEGRG